MKKFLFVFFFSVVAFTLKAWDFEYVKLSEDGIGIIISETSELSDEIYVGLDYEKDSTGIVNYYIRIKFKEDKVMVSPGRKLLIKLKDGSIITLSSTKFEDKTTYGMYAFRWVGWKDNYVTTTLLDLSVIYPISKSDLDKILSIGAVKARIDTDVMFFSWGNGKDDRFSWLLNKEFDAIQKVINRKPEDLYNGF